MKLFATTSPGDPLVEILNNFQSHPKIDLVGTGNTGKDTVDALQRHRIDAVIFSWSRADIARVIRMSGRVPDSDTPAFVVAADSISDARRATSLAYGFDSVLPVSGGAEAAADRLIEIVNGQHRLGDEPSVDGQAVGLLARALVADDPVDREIADLVGSGLGDQEIAEVTGRTIQEVRNRIESIIDANKLSTRTHLAVMRAAQINVPDFS